MKPIFSLAFGKAACAALAVSCLVPAWLIAADQSPRPNVILIMTDDKYD